MDAQIEEKLKVEQVTCIEYQLPVSVCWVGVTTAAVDLKMWTQVQ